MHHRDAFDVIAMVFLPPPPPPGRFTKFWCWLGFHHWGFSCCPYCGKVDKIICASLDERWKQMTEQQRIHVLERAESLMRELKEPS